VKGFSPQVAEIKPRILDLFDNVPQPRERWAFRIDVQPEAAAMSHHRPERGAVRIGKQSKKKTIENLRSYLRPVWPASRRALAISALPPSVSPISRFATPRLLKAAASPGSSRMAMS
jgi:hypothetical protein